MLRVPKGAGKAVAFDLFHRGAVSLLIGLTAMTGSVLCYQWYYYYRYQKADFKNMRAEAEKKMLEEALAGDINSRPKNVGAL